MVGGIILLLLQPVDSGVVVPEVVLDRNLLSVGREFNTLTVLELRNDRICVGERYVNGEHAAGLQSVLSYIGDDENNGVVPICPGSDRNVLVINSNTLDASAAGQRWSEHRHLSRNLPDLVPSARRIRELKRRPHKVLNSNNVIQKPQVRHEAFFPDAWRAVPVLPAPEGLRDHHNGLAQHRDGLERIINRRRVAPWNGVRVHHDEI
mmetsp:Transcript_25354/g.50578  ORF Transcript_25354/g.50578 Transcript_25354/m.50578 type:complete len:207 (+) Transcript_25354:646-1266(+)